MWQIKVEELPGQRGKRYSVYQEEHPMTFYQVLTAWASEGAFRTFYTNFLAEVEYTAFFWEHPPISLANAKSDYEFVLIPSQRLEMINANSTPFQEHFKDGKRVTDFSNLGGDAHLIVPCPQTATDAYAHMASFLRKAKPEQIDLFWERVGQLMLEYLGEKRRWLSTAGLGVSWLHVRLDSYPKYYRCARYRQMA